MRKHFAEQFNFPFSQDSGQPIKPKENSMSENTKQNWNAIACAVAVAAAFVAGFLLISL